MRHRQNNQNKSPTVFTEGPEEAQGAGARKLVDLIDACCSVLTRRAFALVNFRFARCSRVGGSASACKCAWASLCTGRTIEAGHRITCWNGFFAILPGIARCACTCVAIQEVGTRGTVFAWRKLLAWAHLRLTRTSFVGQGTLALALGVGNLDTSAPIFARLGQDTCLKVYPGNDGIAVDELFAGTTTIATWTLTGPVDAGTAIFTGTFCQEGEARKCVVER